MIKKFFETLVKFWFVWFILFCAGCTGVTASVLNDSSALETAGGWAVMLSLGGMAVVFVASLVMKRFAVSTAVAVPAGVSIVAGFLAMVMIGAGQHHPPRQGTEGIEIPNWFDMESCDSAHVSRLDINLPKGSWWTDGQWFYQVKQTGQTIRMEGYGLHEGGAVCAFKVDGDKLLTVMPSEGYSTFVSPDHEVYRFLVKGSDDKTFEVLLAVEPDEWGHLQPMRILQRCDDVKGDERKMLTFVEQGLIHLMEGVYWEDASGERIWHFRDDGTVQMPGMEEAKPYTFELGYQMPTGVIRLPDGSRVAVVRGKHRLLLYKATYNDDEEYWEGTDQLVADLSGTEQHTPDDVAYHRPLLPGLLEFADSAFQQMLHEQLEGHIYGSMSTLNYYLLPYDESDAEQDDEENDDNE